MSITMPESVQHRTVHANRRRTARRMRSAVAALIIVATTMAGVAQARTDQEAFERLAKRAAPNPFEGGKFKPAVACACRFPVVTQVGFLTHSLHGIECQVPFFRPDGSLAGASTCEDFEIIGR
jgi:hypothetical protein